MTPLRCAIRRTRLGATRVSNAPYWEETNDEDAAVWTRRLGSGAGVLESEERWAAWALLTAIIGLDLGYVYINVLLNKANGPSSTPAAV